MPRVDDIIDWAGDRLSVDHDEKHGYLSLMINGMCSVDLDQAAVLALRVRLDAFLLPDVVNDE